MKRSFDRISVDGQLSTSDTVFALANGASGVERRARERRRAAARRGARRAAAPARARDRRRRRGRPAGRADRRERAARRRRAGGALDRQLAARQDRPARRRPQLRAHPPGRRPGLAARRAVRGRPRDRGPPGGLGRATRWSRRRRELVAAAARGRVRPDHARRGRRDRGLLQRPQPGVRAASTRTTRHERRRHPPRGAALHPRVPRQDRGDQVRRRGDDRPGAQGGVRARRGAAQVRRHEPGRGARRRAGHHALHGAARHGGPASSTGCACPTRPPSRWRRWCWSASRTRTSCCASTATASRRSGCAATTACCSPSASSSPRARPTSASSARSSASTPTCSLHIAEDYIPVIASVGADTRGQLLQRQRRRRRGRRGRGARRVQGDLPDRRGGLARRPRRPRRAASRRPPRPRCASGSTSVGGGMRPKLEACLHALVGRRGQRPHRRRPRAALAAARAVHRRGHRDEAVALATQVERERMAPTRNPVEFVRGEGTRLWDDEGNEYLDFLAGISVAQLGHCHPRGGGGGARAGRPADARRQPLLHRAGDAAGGAAVRAVARRQGVPLQLGRRGDRVRDQARPPAPPRAATSWCSRAASTGAPWARCRRPRRRPSRRRSRRSCPGFRGRAARRLRCRSTSAPRR